MIGYRLIVPGEVEKSLAALISPTQVLEREASYTPDAIRREDPESSSLSRHLLRRACTMYHGVREHHRLQLVDL